MAYKRTIRYEPGAALMSCSICGMTYRFGGPSSELHYADDKLFYCTRTCWLGKTKLQDQREQAQSVKRRDNDSPPLIGKAPDWFVP